MAGAHVGLVDAAERGQHPHHELVGRLLQREDQHGTLVFGGLFGHHGVLGHVDDERRLAHRRAGGDDHEIGFLESSRAPVEVLEASGDAGDGVAGLGQEVEPVGDGLGDVADVLRYGLVHAAFADLEDQLFGVVEHVGAGAALRLEGGVGDLVGGGDQAAQRRAFLDDLGVGDDVGGAGRAFHEVDEIVRATGHVELGAGRERFAQGHVVEGLVGFGEFRHDAVDDAVRRTVEVVLREHVGDLEPGVVVEHQAAEERLLGFDGVGRDLQTDGCLGDGRGFSHGRDLKGRWRRRLTEDARRENG